MRRKFNFLIINIILILCFMLAEIVIIKAGSQFEPLGEAVFAIKDIAAKTQIKEDMLEVKKVNIDLINSNTVRSKKEILNKVTRVDIIKGEMLFSGKISQRDEVDNIKADSNNRLFSLELKPDQANGWCLKVDQRVDIIYIPNNTVNTEFIQIPDPLVHNKVNNNQADYYYVNGIVKKLANIRIAALIDEKGKLLDNRTSSASIPKYICLEVTQSQDEFLAFCKLNGKLELSAIP